MIVWLCIVVLVYVFGIGVFYWGLLCVKEPGEVNHTVKVSVLVPVRNEAQVVVQTVEAILSNDYSDFEVLLIDDHSTDDTLDRVASIADDRLRILQLQGGHEGKKAAITEGVARARGEWIVCTDGDTQVSKGWISAHLIAKGTRAALVFGPVRYFEENKFSSWLNLELSALVGVGAATSALGKPSMINGCNYSFAKEIFEQVEGFAGNMEVASGDDEFLLRKVSTRYPGQVVFVTDEKAIVVTEAPQSWEAFYHQRKRWASKWKHHRDPISLVLPIVVFVLYIGWVVGSIFLIPDHLYWVIGVWGVKCLADALFLFRCVALTRSGFSVIPFFLLQIIYPFYVVFFGIASNFGQFRWRNRTYNI
ncbi:hypothetical protein BFP72_12475 [Reichenbachiella sp. 5M10]|uniref:glycosyltransferase n=1 Tax=Reichenbachiella sp. 5M10 TaxID=1889772 RepID=UPI000C148A7F|nr:glycosyltransferase [Reichenbachiella sp. 5M10]PIB36151.1 hypothetical protein BFP72_12475 [Reichenbachiella sp. 5M10]